MNKNVFQFSSYKAYLHSRTGSAHSKPGIKSALARALGCQATYISQILHDKAHLSLEQAELANEFFSHSKEESSFFLLLVQKDRAGTRSLARHFQEQIDQVLSRRSILTSRLGANQTVSQKDQSVYYSSWIYAALHIALTIPELRTQEALSDYFRLPAKRITEVLEFLISAGLVVEKKGGFTVSTTHVRLGKDSHNLIKHHTNWRTQAIESFERQEPPDFHYSGVVSLSSQDVSKIKEIMLETVGETQKLVRESKEQELCVLNIDWFRLKR